MRANGRRRRRLGEALVGPLSDQPGRGGGELVGLTRCPPTWHEACPAPGTDRPRRPRGARPGRGAISATSAVDGAVQDGPRNAQTLGDLSLSDPAVGQNRLDRAWGLGTCVLKPMRTSSKGAVWTSRTTMSARRWGPNVRTITPVRNDERHDAWFRHVGGFSRRRLRCRCRAVLCRAWQSGDFCQGPDRRVQSTRQRLDLCGSSALRRAHATDHRSGLPGSHAPTARGITYWGRIGLRARPDGGADAGSADVYLDDLGVGAIPPASERSRLPADAHALGVEAAATADAGSDHDGLDQGADNGATTVQWQRRPGGAERVR